MNVDGQVSETSALKELLEFRLLQLLSRIGQASTEEIETDLTYLSALMDSYARKDELLEDLLDPRTTDAGRLEIRDALKNQRIPDTRADLEQIRESSKALLERSVDTFRQASALIHKRRDASSRYAPEICNYCEGLARRNRKTCPACNGRRVVLVHQPSLKCPRCGGSGKPSENDRIEFFQDFCVICRGTGWAMTSQ